jgi:hypothetical protein
VPEPVSTKASRPAEWIRNALTEVRRAGRNAALRMPVASSTVMLRSTCIEPSRKPSLMAVTVMSPMRR